MSNYSRGEVILVRYPFSDLSGSKIRPAVIINAPHTSKDVFILPLTSKTGFASGRGVCIEGLEPSRAECRNSSQTRHLHCASDPYSAKSWKVVRLRPKRPRWRITYVVGIIRAMKPLRV